MKNCAQKYEEFCKPQANELRARFGLLTSFKQDQMSVDEWYNKVQTQIGLCNYPQETAQILQRDIFWFFLSNESFISKTLDEGHVSLNNFPASRVRQMAKKLEGSQATAKHMKQVTNEPHASQINLLRHQRTELTPSKAQRRQNKFRHKPNFNRENHQQANYKPNEFTRKKFNPTQIHENSERCHKCGDSQHIEGFRCSARKVQCIHCKKFDHFSSLCYRKQEAYKEGNRSPKAYQLTCNTVFPRYDDSDTSFTEEEEEPFCLQLKILDKSSQEEQFEAEQSQPGEKISQNNRHSKKPKKAMWLKKPAKSIQSINDKNYPAENSENNDYKSQVPNACQVKRRPRKSVMCSDKKSQEPSYKWPVMPAIVNTEDKQLSTPLIRRLCQDEKCQSTRCFKKKSPVRPKYKI